MVKMQGRSTSAFLETGFSSFSKMIGIFDPFFFVLSTCLHLAHVRLERAGGAGTPTSPPAQRAALAFKAKHSLSCMLGGFGKRGCSAQVIPPRSTCPPRLQPARRNLLLPSPSAPAAPHCSRAPRRSSSTAVKHELKQGSYFGSFLIKNKKTAGFDGCRFLNNQPNIFSLISSSSGSASGQEGKAKSFWKSEVTSARYRLSKYQPCNHRSLLYWGMV